MIEGEKSYVFYSQMVQIGHRGEREGGDRPGGRGGCNSPGEERFVGVLEGPHTHTHTHSFLLYTAHSHLQRQDYFKRALLGLYSCPCALSTPTVWRDGGRSQMFPLERLHCEEQQKRHPA